MRRAGSFPHLAAAFAFSVAAFAQTAPSDVQSRGQAPDPCVISPEVQAAIDGLPTRSISETTWEYDQRRLQAIQDLMGRYPDDMLVQRVYVNFEKTRDWAKVNAEYNARYEQRPDDPELAFLYALTLEGRNSREAIRVLERALDKTPADPWPHRILARIYGSPLFDDKKKADAHVKALADGCPATVEAYAQLRTIEDKEYLTSRAARLRKLIETGTDAQSVGGYQTLWPLEFKVRPPSEYPALRKQVSQDLERIRALKLEDKQPWYATLQAGYKLVNDQKQVDSIADEQERRFPSATILNATGKWFQAHTSPETHDPPGKKREFYAELLNQADAWIKERPLSVYFRGYRFRAMSHLDDTSDSDLEKAAEEYLPFAEKDAGPQGPAAYIYLNIAEALSKRHLKPERVLEMARKGLARQDSAEPLSDLQATKDNVAEDKFYRAQDWLWGAAIETGAYLDLKQPERPQTDLAHMGERLESIKDLAGKKQEYRTEYLNQMAIWWGLKGRAAEMTNRSQDAMAFYVSGLTARLDSQQSPEPGVADELADDAHRLWTKLGGTQDGWDAWYGRRAEALAEQIPVTWEKANEPFPAFALTDVNGKAWTADSLKGKVSFLDFWASW
jgi:hypothetical protein